MLLQSSAYNSRKKENSNLSIFVLWLSSGLNFGESVRYINVNFEFAVFLHTVLDPLKQSRFDFSNLSKLLFESNYLKSITEGLSFQIHLCQTQVKLLALSSHTTVDWKRRRCKCTMAYLKDSFIVSFFLFLVIHNLALLQGLVAIITGVGVEKP